VTTGRPSEAIGVREDGAKPPNFIPRDGLLARCVRMLVSEGFSQSRIARELRLNKRTVSRLLNEQI
jgi:DNA-binding transcriptional regulator LsrR (DeoR family)